jgi:hypothetical protein
MTAFVLRTFMWQRLCSRQEEAVTIARDKMKKLLLLLALAAASVVGATGVASAQYYPPGQDRYYDPPPPPPDYRDRYDDRQYDRRDRGRYNDESRRPLRCPPNYTVQDGVCKPYRAPPTCQKGYTVQDGVCKPYTGR